MKKYETPQIEKAVGVGNDIIMTSGAETFGSDPYGWMNGNVGE